MTYRELLEAISTARELESALETARGDRRRFSGTPEQQDEADAFFRAADRALDEPIIFYSEGEPK